MEPGYFGRKDGNQDKKQQMPIRGLAIWLLLLALFLTVYQIFSQRQEKYQKLPYSPDFVQLVEQGKIRKCEVVIDVSGVQFVRGELLELDERTGRPRRFRVDVPVTDDLIKLLREKRVNFEFKPQNP